MMISMFVEGEPIPQGSLKSFGHGRVTSDNPRLKAWRQKVRAQAAREFNDVPLFAGPIELVVSFYLPRPAGHYGTGRNAGLLRGSARKSHTVKPDLDKLVRAVGDALTGTWFVDDAQIVSLRAYKTYDDATGSVGCNIRVLEVAP